jgi:hypothetical protein
MTLSEAFRVRGEWIRGKRPAPELVRQSDAVIAEHHRAVRHAAELKQRRTPTRCICGARLGLHRWGTNQCPNPAWRPCSGRSEWREEVFCAGIYGIHMERATA